MSLHVLSSQASRLFCNTLLAQRPNSLRHWANRCVAAKFAIHRQSPAVGSSTLCTHYRGLDACVKRQDLQGMVWTSLLMLGRVDCLVRIVVTVRGYHLQLLRMCPAICNKKPDYVCARTRSRGCEAVLGPVWQSELVTGHLRREKFFTSVRNMSRCSVAFCYDLFCYDSFCYDSSRYLICCPVCYVCSVLARGSGGL